MFLVWKKSLFSLFFLGVEFKIDHFFFFLYIEDALFSSDMIVPMEKSALGLCI
jgi:hypothetical protein